MLLVCCDLHSATFKDVKMSHENDVKTVAIAKMTIQYRACAGHIMHKP